MSELIKYTEACRALAEAKAVDEVKSIKDKADAMRLYAHQAKNKQLEVDAGEIRFRAERRLGQLIVLQKETVGLNTGNAGKGRPSLGGSDEAPPKSPPPTLAEAGIDKKLSSRAQKLAAIPEEEFETTVGDWRENVSQENERVTVKLLQDGERHSRAKILTGDTEWYTPAKYIESARVVLGSIDLDPASNDFAQTVVKASNYFTAENDGLSQAWTGRIFLNPPYKHPLVEEFIDKLIGSPDISAVLLTNNATDTGWWHKAAVASNAICFTRGRISFYQVDGTKSSPTHGQTFFYFGQDVKSFRSEFMKYGMIV